MSEGRNHEGQASSHRGKVERENAMKDEKKKDVVEKNR